ncbi:MAG: biotin/lipoyl-binding protein [Lachnospiraceae bacterium]
MSKKKVGIIIGAAVLIIAVTGGGLWYFLRGNGAGGKKSADKVYVESVASLLAVNSGAQNRYSGVVEPQETWEVNKNAEKTIKEVLVTEGASVEVGTPLFVYDTETLEAELAQAKLDLEGVKNEISNYQAQIKQLTEEKNTAQEEEKFQYTSQIQSLQNSIKQSEYNIESKKIEMNKKQKSIDNSTVTSEIAGVVKTINESGTDPSTGQAVAYMTVLATGDYRIKGTISEQSVQAIAEGQTVIIRSRLDETKTWAGTISKVDMENQEKGNSNDNMATVGGMEGTQTSSKYPFYVAIDAIEGLILGQHVYIEPDQGQTKAKEGIWLFEGYIVTDEKEPYIWVANKKNKLEKRKVELGEYDEEMGEYQIVSGLSKEDYIAFPMVGFYEGLTTVTDPEAVDYSSPLYNQGTEEDATDGTMNDMIDEGMTEDGSVDEGMMDNSVSTEEVIGEDGANADTKDALPEENKKEMDTPVEKPEG